MDPKAIGPRARPVTLAAVVVLALLFSTFLLLQTGGLSSAFIQVYLLPVLLAGYYLGGVAGLVVGLVAGFLTTPFGPLPGAAQPSNGWIFHPAEMIIVGGLTGLLSDRLRNQIQSTREQSAQLAASEQRAMSFLDAQQRYLEELETVLAIDRAILSEMDVDQAAQHLAQLSGDLFQADLCLVGLLQDGRNLVVPAVYGRLADQPGLAERLGGRRIGEGAAGWAVLTEEIIQVPDVQRDPRLTTLAADLAAGGIGSVLAAPLVTTDRPLGALVVAFARPKAYTRQDVDRLERLAPQAAVTILDAERLQQLRCFAEETIRSLAEAIEARDQYTSDHCARIERHAVLTAQELGVPPNELEAIRYGALLHDLGKIGVPEHVLQKPAALTPAERRLMERHTVVGAQIACRVSFLGQVVPLIYYHQERYDASGYPEGLAGDQIPLGARIISVVDAYDAMTSDRPYRQAMPHSEVVAWLKEQAGRLFDPAVVEAFLHVLEREGICAA